MPKLLQFAWAARGGGLERVVQDIAEEAPARGWDSVITYRRREPPPGTTTRYVKLTSGTYGPWPFELIRLIRSENPDVVHLHGPIPGSTGAIAARLAGSRNTVYTDHFMHSLRPTRFRLSRRATSWSPAVNVAVSHAVARSLIEDARVAEDRVVVIPNGTRVVPPLRAPDRSASKRLVYVSNFSPWKGHAHLLDALDKIDRGLDFQVILVGHGRLMASVRAMIEKRGLADLVVLTGHLEDPWTVAEGAWAYIHPSAGEGLPLAIMEAMMRGLPVVGTKTAGIPEIVTDEVDGLLVRSGDTDNLARAITRMLTDHQLRDQTAVSARTRAVAEFGLDRMLDRYFDLYDRMSSSSP
jgi:glycosyltransferase involved in cell wall biosynthesis